MMRRMRTPRQFLSIAALVGIVSVGLVASQGTPQSEADKLRTLVASYAAERAAIAGVTPSAPGSLVVDRGPSGSPEQAQALANQATTYLATLHALTVSQLTHDEWILYGISESQARLDAENTADFFWLPSPITPYSSALRTLAAPFSSAPLKTQANLDAYIAALAQLPVTMKAYETRLEGQIQHGVALPREELRLSIPLVRSLAVAPPKSPFSVTAARLSAFPAAEQTAFAARVDETIASVVNPSIEGLAKYIDGPYRAHAVPNVGVSQYPNGAAFYRYLIHLHTGLNLTPQQIHNRGLAEVARINCELEKLRVEAGFKGSIVEFKKYLRTDKRFYPTTAAEIGEKMMAAIHLIEPKMPQYFSMMPKAPYGVRRLALELEPSMTYGIYTLPESPGASGYYNYNGLNPETRSITMLTAIVFHELLPGHHYQMNRLREDPRITGLRRTVMYTAYTEGWGEYSSDLAREMGAYPDVWTKAGRLGMDLFTSSRLVVDTGMNALGWPRERAMQFMKDNTFEGDTQIDTETLRYSTDLPGQALAYKLGALSIKDARARVEKAQGASFDIRKFHDYLLDGGEMPLGMFDQHFTCWLKGEQHKK